MTDRGEYILVNAEDVGAELPELLKVVENGGRRVRIVRDGKPVAEISPIATAAAVAPGGPFRQHPQLSGVRLAADAFAPAGDDEWPEECR